MLLQRFALASLLLPSLVGPVGAQRPQTIRLKPTNSVHPAEFSGVARVRELEDGRLIVLDSMEHKLYLVDFRLGTSTPFGRVGDGPEEYRWPNGLFALPGDSTVVTDARTRRLIFFHGEHPAATIPATAPVMNAVEGFIIGADRAGYIDVAFLPRGLGRARDQGDSILIARFARANGRGDTLTRMRSGFGGPPGSATKATPLAVRAAGPPDQRQYMRAPVIGDEAIGFPDGWIAVARMEPYRVDWIDPAGMLHRGRPIPVPVTPLDDKEKRFYLARVAKLDGKPAGNPEDIRDWRPAIPPFWGFYIDAPHQVPGGIFMIRRAPTVVRPTPTYDFVDRSGAYLGQLVLPAGESVVGFCARSVYVVVVDSDGLESLRRHPWPRGRSAESLDNGTVVCLPRGRPDAHRRSDYRLGIRAAVNTHRGPAPSPCHVSSVDSSHGADRAAGSPSPQASDRVLRSCPRSRSR